MLSCGTSCGLASALHQRTRSNPLAVIPLHSASATRKTNVSDKKQKLHITCSSYDINCLYSCRTCLTKQYRSLDIFNCSSRIGRVGNGGSDVGTTKTKTGLLRQYVSR